MKSPEVVYTSFRDELEKIAGTGEARFGKTPRRMATAAMETGRAAKGLGKFFKKIAKIDPRIVGGSMVTGGALTLYGQKKIKKLHQDYQMGRQMRQAGA